MRKKLINFVFVGIAIAGLSAITGCKKGENDPFLSLRSRKARITGEWKLSEGTSTNTSIFGGVSNTSTTIYTGTTCSSNGSTYQYSETFTIEKDGTYKVDIIDDGYAYSISGNWFFAGKIKDIDLKNKEAIMLVAQEYNEPGYTETYNGLYGGEVLIMDQLKNKEVIFKGEFSYTGGLGSSNSSTYDRTFEKQ